MKFNRSVFQSLAMISQFGINMLVPVLACSFLGIFLDKKFETSYLVIILFFVGAAAGFRNIFQLSKKIFEEQSGEASYLHKGRHKAREKSSPVTKEGNGKAKAGAADHESTDSENEQNII